MAIILTGICTELDDPFEKAVQTARKQLKVRTKDILSAYPVKSSIDARHPEKIKIVYAVGIELAGNEEAVLRRANLSNASLRRSGTLELSFGTRPMVHRPGDCRFWPCRHVCGSFTGTAGVSAIDIGAGNGCRQTRSGC